MLFGLCWPMNRRARLPRPRRWFQRKLVISAPCGGGFRCRTDARGGCRCQRPVLTPTPDPAAPQTAAVPPPGETLTFERDVRPIFKAYCFDCHGAEAEHKGNLDLRLRRLVLKGGETGPAIVPGDATTSLLIQKLHEGEMPPTGKKVPVGTDR